MSLLEAEKARLLEQYRKGLADGVKIMLDQIEDKDTAAGFVYTGPIPDELKRYLADVRERLQEMGGP